jgi:pimeloyl-ACP methyl ester carboxylesterase
MKIALALTAATAVAVGASGSMGDFVGNQAERYAGHVTPVVIPGSGHWIYEERPAEMTALLLGFLRR